MGEALGDEKLKAEAGGDQAADRLQAAIDERREQITAHLLKVEAFTTSQPWAALGIATRQGARQEFGRQEAQASNQGYLER